MRKVFLTAVLGLSVLMTMAQTRAGGSSSSKTPAGSAFALSDGSTVTKNGEALTTSSSDYNVVQVTNGTLTMTDCTVTKTGDYSSSYSGDDTSFYGTNSAVFASGSGATINMTGNSYVSTLTNNGTVNKNGYALTVGSSSGSGTINETTGIESLKSFPAVDPSAIYTLDGRRADSNTKGIVIRNGKKYVVK